MNLNKEQFCKIVQNTLEMYTREMEAYSYFGSNLGVPQDDYEDVASDLWNILSTGGEPK